MGMVCHLRQISRSESQGIDVNPGLAYELVFGGTAEGPQISSEKAIQLTNALCERYAETLDRIRQANANRVPISEEDRAAHKQWLGEFQALTAPWSTRNRGTRNSLELNIDKSWHGIHFLLTGRPHGGNPPHSLAILGGKEVPDLGDLMSFGPARKVSPEEVQEVTIALEVISVRDLLARYDLAEMLRHEIYAAGQDPQEDQDYFGHFYQKMRIFYKNAAKKGNAVLVYLT